MEFVFLSRFWGKERKEGRKEVEFSILRSAIASTSHLKITHTIVMNFITKYCKVASTNTSHLEPHPGIHRLLKKGKIGLLCTDFDFLNMNQE